MMTLDELVVACRVRRVEVRRWVQAGWLLPLEVDGDLQFAEVDLARAHLIRDLRRALGVNEAAVPVILDLIDQRQTMEQRLRSLLEALADQPEETRRSLAQRLRSTSSR
jgi:chaperone modulatory protein CbpM